MATLRAVTSLHSRGQTSRVITGQHELLTATSWVLMGQHVRKNSCAPLTPLSSRLPTHTRARAPCCGRSCHCAGPSPWLAGLKMW